jgi:hypothetical protein
MQSKYNEVKKLEQAMVELNTMFTELGNIISLKTKNSFSSGLLVKHNGEMINSIERSVLNTKIYAHRAEKELINSRRIQHKNQKLQMWACSCCTVFLAILVVSLYVIKS